MKSIVSEVFLGELQDGQGHIDYKIDLRREGWQNTACLSFAKLPFSTLVNTKTTFLHPEELQRFSQITFPRRKHSFLLGRYVAKKALSQYLPEKQNAILVRSGVFQQPFVANLANNNLGISISHSYQIGACIVFPQEHPMGLDVELIRSEDLGRISFPMTENERRLQFQVNKPVELFQAILWTVKEALSKVLATGLMTPLKVYEIKSIEERENYILSTFTNFGQYKTITFEFSDYVCSLALPLNTNIFIHEAKSYLVK